MFTSDDLSGAVRRVVRFAKLLSQRAELGLADLGDRWRLQAERRPLLPGFRPPIDESLAGLMQGFQEILGRPLIAASMHFSYPRPTDTTVHQRLFGPNLRFGEATAAITLWRRDLQTPTVSPDPGLTRYLDELAEVHLRNLPQIDTFTEKVRQVVWTHLSEGVPALREVAREVAVSTRSLQRRLREEGTSYLAVVESLRREKARLLLRDPALAIYEIGFLLGYSDPSAFHRAFRRWEDLSPSQYRAQRIN